LDEAKVTQPHFHFARFQLPSNTMVNPFLKQKMNLYAVTVLNKKLRSCGLHISYGVYAPVMYDKLLDLIHSLIN